MSSDIRARNSSLPMKGIAVFRRVSYTKVSPVRGDFHLQVTISPGAMLSERRYRTRST